MSTRAVERIEAFGAAKAAEREAKRAYYLVYWDALLSSTRKTVGEREAEAGRVALDLEVAYDAAKHASTVAYMMYLMCADEKETDNAE